MLKELLASESNSEVEKQKKNPLEDGHYNIVIEKQIYHGIIYTWIFFFALEYPNLPYWS